MRNLIREYFYYSRLERNGIFVLSFLCIAFFLFPKLYKQSIEKPATDFSQVSKELAAFEKALQLEEKETVNTASKELFKFDPNTVTKKELQALGLSPKVINIFLNFRSKGGKFYKKEDLKKVYGLSEKEYLRLENYIEISNPKNDNPRPTYKTPDKKVKEVVEPFNFDPNEVSQDDLERLGFPKRAANNLIKFREKGGTFRHKEELSKIYGVEEALFEKLFPYIVFKENQLVKTPQGSGKSTPPKPADSEVNFYLDINTASTEDWQKIYGIGPYYAKTILTLRNDLGGFHSIDQVGEAYNLPDSTFQKIKPYLKLITPPKKLNLNTITAEELAKHPYLNRKEAKIIINYRLQHGSFSNLDDLEKTKILTPERIKKIKPYLNLE
ncbi:MAG: competence protein ComEA [Saprospiraceae bacterium]|jgi:competence protein ComEA